MKKILLGLIFLLSFQHLFAQCTNEKGYNDFPFTQNGLTVSSSGTGGYTLYSSAYNSCGVATKANSIWLGNGNRAGSFTNTFSSPVNDMVYNITASNSGEQFTISVDNGTPQLTIGGTCTSGWIIAGSTLTVTGTNIYGGTLQVHSTQPFTSITIAHNGGGGGSLVTMCMDAVLQSAGGGGSETITFAALPTKTYGDADFSAGATSDNTDVPVTYASSNTAVATIVNGNIHVVGAGTTTITASQAADANHSAAADVQQTLTVDKKTIAVTANAQSKTYGDADPALTYTFSSALVSGDSFSGSLSRDAGENKGTYAIKQGTLALGSNYTLTYSGADLTINSKSITVTADSKSKTYGQADPALTYQLTSGALITGDNFTGSLTRDAGESAGTYAIKQGTLTAGNNYTITYSGANLAITPVALTITAGNKTKVYGAANPALTASYSGFVNGDNAAGLTTQPVLTTTATASSPVGNYAITASGAVNPNYTISYVAGSLSVTQATLAITADNKTKVYGAANPALTATYSGFVNGDDASKLSSPAVLATTATAASGAGTYDITVSGAASNNYTIAFNKGTLAVTKATLTVTADNQSKVYGTANPALTVSYSGFVNGNGISALTTQPVATTTATTASGIGNYAIVPAGGVGANYSFNYVNGTLTITPAVRTLDFSALEYKAYGNADFDAGATASTGETVIYTSSNTNVATIVNGKVHIVGAGMANITATVAANPNYTSAPAVTQTLVVNKGQQAITFAAIPNQVKGAQYSLPPVTATSGLPVTLTSSDAVIASISGQTLTSNRLGRVSIIATQPGNDNYLPAAVVTQSFDVLDAAGEEVLIRKAVSPNGDGINDFLYIEGVNQHLNNSVTVINRNGVKVFEVKNYDNSSKVFDGHSNITGAMQQAGTYFYLLEYTVDGVGRRKTGWFILKY